MSIEPLPNEDIKRDTTRHEVEAVMTPVSTEAKDLEIALKTQGQRKVSDMWEDTQRKIALAVTTVALTVAAWLAVSGQTDAQTAAFVFIYGVANLVIGFYFGRTNHQREGGVGTKSGEGR